uniref:P53 induced protein n=1 Tax=Echinostoma caproni TaxID=27848 RepID=A0A183A2H7_9TREM
LGSPACGDVGWRMSLVKPTGKTLMPICTHKLFQCTISSTCRSLSGWVVGPGTFVQIIVKPVLLPPFLPSIGVEMTGFV